MIELRPTQEQIEMAKELYEFKELRGSITKGKGNVFGALGEIMVYDYFSQNHSIEFLSTYDYDMIVDGRKVDVKTKHTTVTPKDNYFCSVAAFNTKQKCQYYFFVRVMSDMSKCWLLGYKKKDSFFDEAVFKKKGEHDVNGWTFKDDCYNLEVGKLEEFKPRSEK